MPNELREDAASLLKAHLREDLRAAMQTGSSLTIKAVRGLLAAVDNAQAVPVGGAHIRYTVLPFGHNLSEVPRRILTKGDIEILIEKEINDRNDTAATLECCGRPEAASTLRAEAKIVARYGQ
jgi:uncharacterized protein YqeY